MALTIVGLAAVGTLSAFGGEVRAADRARWTLTAATLAEEQLARLRLTPRRTLESLPDSLRRGTFAAPFASFAWTAAATPMPTERDLIDLSVRVSHADGSLERVARVYRPRRLTSPR